MLIKKTRRDFKEINKFKLYGDLHNYRLPVIDLTRWLMSSCICNMDIVYVCIFPKYPYMSQIYLRLSYQKVNKHYNKAFVCLQYRIADGKCNTIFLHESCNVAYWSKKKWYLFNYHLHKNKYLSTVMRE